MNACVGTRKDTRAVEWISAWIHFYASLYAIVYASHDDRFVATGRWLNKCVVVVVDKFSTTSAVAMFVQLHGCLFSCLLGCLLGLVTYMHALVIHSFIHSLPERCCCSSLSLSLSGVRACLLVQGLCTSPTSTTAPTLAIERTTTTTTHSVQPPCQI